MAHPGRLALRVEGDMWNAYWAPELTTMQGAVLLGSIRMALVDSNSVLKDGFMKFMQIVMGAIIADTTGLVIERWNVPQAAPESERGGSA